MKWVILGLSFLGFTGCVLEGFPRDTMLRDTAFTVIEPAYAGVEAQLSQLQTELDALCSAPDASTLAAAQSTWREAQLAASALEPFDFGPAMDEQLLSFLGRRPTDGTRIEDIIAGTEDLTDETTASLGSNVRGLPAIEYVLFGGDGQAPLTALTIGANAARRCQFMAIQPPRMLRKTQDVASAWANGGFRDSFAVDSQMSLQNLVNRMIEAAEFTADTRLGIPMGLRNGGIAEPDQLEAPYSDLAWEIILANLQGWQTTYLGDDTGESLALTDLVQSRGGDLDGRMRAALEQAISAMSLPGPPEDDLVQRLDRVQSAWDDVKLIQRLAQAELVTASSVTLLFNDNDGD